MGWRRHVEDGVCLSFCAECEEHYERHCLRFERDFAMPVCGGVWCVVCGGCV